MTIEHYFIAQKIERVKELLLYNELTLSEIAYQLHYSTVGHLSNQFKKNTGLTLPV
jgi:AraC-like DNA-binding protein